MIADKIDQEGIEILKKSLFFELRIDDKISRAELLSCIGDYHVLVVRSRTKVDEELIRAGKNLKIIARAGVGLDNIDVPIALEHGIRILNVEDKNSISVAEHTIGLLIALARHIPQTHRKLKNNVWERENFIGIEINNKTLGVIGLGRIGSEVTKRAQAMGMQVVAYDPYCSDSHAKELGVRQVTLHDLLANSDFLTIHIPKNAETTDLISHREFQCCKKGIRVINTARGGIINEAALLQAIVDGTVSGAALDVFENEPNIKKEFLIFNQIILTPHIAGNTQEAQTRIAISIAHQIVNVFETEPLLSMLK
jgi:D-3-phosphoglycerate dehydrogenase